LDCEQNIKRASSYAYDHCDHAAIYWHNADFTGAHSVRSLRRNIGERTVALRRRGNGCLARQRRSSLSRTLRNNRGMRVERRGARLAASLSSSLIFSETSDAVPAPFQWQLTLDAYSAFIREAHP
jgi:hypothetical protein